MDPVFIGYYLYTDGIRHSMNRKLDFYQINDQKIEARLNIRFEDGWKQVRVIPEERICVQAESTTQKAKRFAEDRQLGKPIFTLLDTNFSDPKLSIEEKKYFIHQLQPEGPYRIGISNVFPEEGGFGDEDIEEIRFYNPH